MEEMEKNSRAIRCLEMAIKEHGERLTTLTNTKNIPIIQGLTTGRRGDGLRRGPNRDGRREKRIRNSGRRGRRGRRKTRIQSQERGRGEGKMGQPYRPSWPNATQITKNQKGESGTVV